MKIRCFYKVKFLKRLHIQAITLYPLILFAESQDQISERLYRHELEHIYQVEREGWIPFYFRYLKFYSQLRSQNYSHEEAYLRIPYEMDARAAEKLLLSQTEKEKLGWVDWV